MPYERKLNEVWVYGIGHTIKIHIICWIVCDCIKNNLLDFQVCRIFSHPIVSTLLRCLDVPTFFPGAQLGVQYSSKYIQKCYNKQSSACYFVWQVTPQTKTFEKLSIFFQPLGHATQLFSKETYKIIYVVWKQILQVILSNSTIKCLFFTRLQYCEHTV